MNIPKTRERRRTPAAMVATMLGALALAGCSSGNIGESWQCPLAKGGTCDSVAAADPAVPDADAAGMPLPREPLWRVRPAGREAARPEAEAPCTARCDGGFDPFGWLMRLFEGGGHDPAAAVDAKPEATASAPPENPPAADSTVSTPDLTVSPSVVGNTAPREAEPAAAALPAEPALADDDTDGEALRTDEVVARIWIAPFVDAEGVYREASHVRVVLEPAGWRLPR